jgi:hypothetical protein
VTGDDAHNAYTITADSKRTPLLLIPSNPHHDSVRKDKYNQYKLEVDDASQDVGIRLTAYSGEANIFVAKGYEPTVQSYMWASRIYGNETMSITADQRDAVDAGTGELNIAILGVRRATYILTATTSNQSAISLISDVPLQGLVDWNKTDHYVLDLPMKLDYNITISLNSFSGDADLYAKQCFDAREPTDCLFT